MTGGAHIRLLVEADAEAYSEIRRRALLEAPLAFAASPVDDIASSLEAVRRLLCQAPESVVIGAFDDGLVGIVGLHRDRHVKAAHKAHVWGMYVAPEHRGRGNATALLTAALRHGAALNGISWIHLSVTSAASAARRIYERAGFHVWGIEPEALRHDGQSVIDYHMAIEVSHGTGGILRGP